MRFAVYYRVSTDRQDHESQKLAVEEWLRLRREPPASVEVYVDDGFSGKTTARPAFQRMLEDAKAQRFDPILVYKLDRFSRSASTAIKLILELDEAGVGFVSATQPILNLGSDNPFRRTMLAAFAEISEIERETIVARVKAGMAAARARGVRLGAPVKADAAMREAAAELRRQGNSYRFIARELGVSLGTVGGMFHVERST